MFRSIAISLFLAQQGLASIELSVLSSYSTNVFDEGAAEVVAHDPCTQRLFVVNADADAIDILDVSRPEKPKLFKQAKLSSEFSPNSVDVLSEGGYFAVAAKGDGPLDLGAAIFYDIDGLYLGQVEAGFLPDMLTFTPDGEYLLIANEGELAEGELPDGSSTLIDPRGSVTILKIDKKSIHKTLATKPLQIDFKAFDGKEDTLRAMGVRIRKGAKASEDFEPEYIAVSPDSKMAYVTLQENNAVAVIDIRKGRLAHIYPLGVKDHSINGNGLDASDSDGKINIATYKQVLGLYMPDAIASFTIGKMTYFATANEGDGRELDGYTDEDRVSGLILDPDAFPGFMEMQSDANLGRLTVSTVDGDTNGNGQYDKLAAFGSRSFSIYDEYGYQVFDSGDDFEQITAEMLPTNCNSNNDENDSFDNRSDNKGPEPEGITVGEVGCNLYAFIGLERIGGVMVRCCY